MTHEPENVNTQDGLVNESEEKSKKKKSVQINPYKLERKLFERNGNLVKINGVICTPTQYGYKMLDEEGLTQLVQRVLRKEAEEAGSVSFVKKVVKVLMQETWIDYPDAATSGYLGFKNGILNLNTDEFIPMSDYLSRARTLKFPIFYDTPDWEELSIPSPPDKDPPTPPIPLITYTLNANYLSPEQICNSESSIGNVEHSNVDAFISWIANFMNNNPSFSMFPSDVVDCLWEFMGCILVPDTTIKAFFLLQGAPNSGKSVLGTFLEGFFPKERVVSVQISEFGAEHLPAAMIHSCLCLCMDISAGKIPNNAVSVLKMLTGSDLGSITPKYQEAVTYRNYSKYLFATNFQLQFDESDEALLNRILCIQFGNSLRKEDQDPDLPRKLDAERDYFAYKALEGYKRFIQNGRRFSALVSFQPSVKFNLSPKAVITAFVNNCCYRAPGTRAMTKDLFAAYQIFCRANGFDAIETKSGFSQKLSSTFAGEIQPVHKRVDNQNLRGYQGICLLPQWMPQPMPQPEPTAAPRNVITAPSNNYNGYSSNNGYWPR